MPGKTIDDLIEGQQERLDSLGEKLVDAVHHARESMGERGPEVFDFLHGVWLGHPLHPALTDVPVGAWTVAAVLDAVDGVMPKSGVRDCADACIGLGIAAGLAAAPTGVADWHHTFGRDRRLGLVHGLLNYGALGLYATSLLIRRTRARPLGVGLSMLAYTAAAFSAYLGGELVYRQGIGVNRGAWAKHARRYVAVLPEAELEEGKPRRVEVNDTPVMLVRQGGRIHALAETCSHLGGPLAKGNLRGDTVECPWHGSRFSLADGSVAAGPATFPQQTYEVRVKDGQIEVRASG